VIGTIWSDGRPRRRGEARRRDRDPPARPLPLPERPEPPPPARGSRSPPVAPTTPSPPQFSPPEMAISRFREGGGEGRRAPARRGGRRSPGRGRGRRPEKKRTGGGRSVPPPRCPPRPRRWSLAWIFKGRPTRSGRFQTEKRSFDARDLPPRDAIPGPSTTLVRKENSSRAADRRLQGRYALPLRSRIQTPEF
jgi:hypothetical protein